jgi:uncharacterized protein (TIGR00369 family)
MDLIDDKYCFACGTENEGGLRLSFSSSNGKAVSEFTLQKKFQGYKDIVHGGITSTILDEAMIHAAMSLGLKPVTAEITVRFKAPVHVNAKLKVDAEVVNKGPRMAETSGRIIDAASGNVLAEATAKLMLLKRYP